MQLAELQKQILSDSLNRYMQFFGDEYAVQDIYLNRIYEKLGAEVIRLDTVQEAYQQMVKSRMSKSPRCFVVRDDSEYLKQDKIWDRVKKQCERGTDYLILIYSKLDKRSKYYKQSLENLVEFARLSESVLEKYILKSLKLTHKNCDALIAACENDYSRILLEMDKIKHYMNIEKVNADEALEMLLEQGVIYKPIGDITFKFTDSILLRNMHDTGTYLRQAKLIAEPSIMVLSILYSGFKQILMVQGLGKDQSEPAKRTGLTPWQVKCAKEKQGHYTISELINALRVIQDVEKGIKTGTIDEDIALEYVVLKIMGGNR